MKVTIGLVSAGARNGFEYHMVTSTSFPCVESAAPRIPEGPTVSPEPLIRFVGEREPKKEVKETTLGAIRICACAELLSNQAAALIPSITNTVVNTP